MKTNETHGSGVKPGSIAEEAGAVVSAEVIRLG
jgi:hypothetical protein